MSTRTTFLLASSASLILAAGVFACSGDSSTTVIPDAGGSDGSTSDAKNDTSTTSDAAPDVVATDAGSDASDCQSLPKAQCQQCCLQAHPGTATIVTEAAKCACQTPGLCKTQCATTLCAAKSADQTCSACLQSADAGSCLAQAAAACSNDPDCTAGLQCGNACK
jgi:hypothetical protein